MFQVDYRPFGKRKEVLYKSKWFLIENSTFTYPHTLTHSLTHTTSGVVSRVFYLFNLYSNVSFFSSYIHNYMYVFPKAFVCSEVQNMDKTQFVSHATY